MNVRQCFLAVLLTVPVFKITMLPGYLSAGVGRDAYLALALAMLVDLGVFALILAVNDRGGIVNVLKGLFGKTVARIIVGLIWVFMTVKLALQCQDALHYMINMLFDHNEKFVIVLPLALAASYIGSRSSRTLGRVTECIAYACVLPLLLGIFFNKAPTNYGAITPVLADGVLPLSKIKNVAIWFGDYLPFLFIRLDEGERKKSPVLLLAGLIGTVITVGVCLTFTGLYENASAYIPDAFEKITRYIILGSEVGRLDVFPIVGWLLAVVLHVSVIVNAISRSASELYVDKVKNPLVAGTGVIFFFLALLTGSEEKVYAMGEYLLTPCLVFNLMIPAIFFVCALIYVRVAKNKRSKDVEKATSQ